MVGTTENKSGMASAASSVCQSRDLMSYVLCIPLNEFDVSTPIHSPVKVSSLLYMLSNDDIGDVDDRDSSDRETLVPFQNHTRAFLSIRVSYLLCISRHLKFRFLHFSTCALAHLRNKKILKTLYH